MDAMCRPPLHFDEIATAPLWTRLNPQQLAEFSRFVAAVALVPLWRDCLDGALLRRAAAALGETRFNMAWNLNVSDLDDTRIQGCECVDAAELEQLGAALLLASLPTGLAAILQTRLPRTTPHPDSAGAGRIVDAAMRCGEIH
jgi:hypothetical protein